LLERREPKLLIELGRLGHLADVERVGAHFVDGHVNVLLRLSLHACSRGRCNEPAHKSHPARRSCASAFRRRSATGAGAPWADTNPLASNTPFTPLTSSAEPLAKRIPSVGA